MAGGVLEASVATSTGRPMTKDKAGARERPRGRSWWTRYPPSLDRWVERFHLAHQGPVRYVTEIWTKELLFAVVAGAVGAPLYALGLQATGVARAALAAAVFFLLAGATIALAVEAWRHSRRSWEANEMALSGVVRVWAAVLLAAIVAVAAPLALLFT